jgi:3-oxoacyl-[acyl-carrier protein] reductase
VHKMSQLVAIVSGGSRGIGRAVVEALASRSYRVAVVSREPVAAALAVGAAHPHTSIQPFVCDVSQPVAIGEAVKNIMQRWGRIDLLVNAAGVRV